MGKPKSKLERKSLEPHSIKAFAILALVVISVVLSTVNIVNALSNDLPRIETAQAQKTNNVPSETKEAPTEPQKKPVEKPAEKKEEPKKEAPKVDPNGCEAKGMWYRADNNECIPKTTAAAPAAKPATAQRAATSGSGDCSLVNNYDWPRATAMRVCMQESGGNPNNANWADDHTSWAGCMGSFGLMQINCSHGQVFDGARNMAIAYSMWKGAGNTFWQDWPNTCRKVGC